MKKLSTPCMNETDNKKQNKHIAPQKQTINFLHQFARVYYSENKLAIDLCGFVLN